MPPRTDQNGGPIIIVGTGRCGSTLLHRVLALHDELGWLSPFNEVLPGQPWVSALSPLYRSRLPARIRHLKAFPKPFEAYRFWEHYLPGFSRRDRPLTPDDVPRERVPQVRRATDRILQRQRRARLLVKVTGWSRIAYFHTIFPGAVFIHLSRDPRAVVSSWMRAGWLDVTSPPDNESWQWGSVPPAYQRLWHELGGSPELSVALKIRLDLDDIANNMALLPDHCTNFRYEDVLTDSESTLRAICEFTGIPWAPRFERVVSSLELYDPRDKWRRHLTDAQGERILEFMERSGEFSDHQNPGPELTAKG